MKNISIRNMASAIFDVLSAGFFSKRSAGTYVLSKPTGGVIVAKWLAGAFSRQDVVWMLFANR